MRYAIFSDIQGNRQAWEAVLEDMKRQCLELTICLGDVVGLGPNPIEVLHSVREESDNLILGDCDAAVTGLLDGGTLAPGTRQSIEWTRGCLDQASLDFLAALPPAIKTGQLLFTHAEALELSRFNSIDTVEKARANFAPSEHHVTFVGHGHRPAIFVLSEDGSVAELPAHDCQLVEGKRYIVNVGSVGTPPGAGDIRACYAVYDSDTRELRFRQLTVPAEACWNEWTAAGLQPPSWLLEAPHPPPPNQAGTSGPGSPAPPVSAILRSKWPLVALATGVIVLVLTASVIAGFMLVSKLRSAHQASAHDPGDSAPSAAGLPAPDAPQAPGLTGAEEDTATKQMTATAPSVVVPHVPEPEPGPESHPEPGPDPAAIVPAPGSPPPPSGPPPIPPAPATATAPLSLGLVFYTPLDEPEDEFTARDLVGGRNLDVSGGLPGALGRVGFACRLEKQNGSEPLFSTTKPLPPMKAITISFWMRRPDPADGGKADGKPAPAEPPMNLVSLKGYCEVRLENSKVVATMNPKGQSARVAFPPDFDWHHVLVENGGGKTAVWIDHRSQSNVVAEQLAAPPKKGVAVQVGSKGAHFHVDEIAIWNRRFTNEERQLLYRNGRLDQPILRPPKLVAYWKLDDKSLSRIFADTTGDHPLGALRSWSPLPAIAPDPVPFTGKSNARAAQVWQLSERPEDAGSFQMTVKAGFTYEGWVKLGADSMVLLGGVPSNAEGDSRGGWRIEARPVKGTAGDLVFTYQNGPVSVEAHARDLPIYNGQPHHFAAVWNPLATPDQGRMELHLDRKLVATSALPLSDVGPSSDSPFRIIATKAAVVLDEIRFTCGALTPAEFLNAGAGNHRSGVVAAPQATRPKNETPMQRRARETRERKEKADARREEKRREEDAKRKRKRL